MLFLILLSCIPTFYSVSEIRAVHRNSCRNRLKQISLALYNYQDTYGSFPPAYLADENGKPMHSWRVLILPFLEGQDIFDAYDFNEPWNGPNNSKLANKFNRQFHCPTAHDYVSKPPSKTDTQYFAILDDTTAWPGAKAVKASDVTDGVHKTFFVIEVAGKGINWMEPRDVTLAEAVKLLSPEANNKSSPHKHKRVMAYADGHVKEAGVWDDPKGIEALFTIAGNDQAVDIDLSDSLPEKFELSIAQRNFAISLTFFILTVLLPLPWAIKKYKAT